MRRTHPRVQRVNDIKHPGVALFVRLCLKVLKTLGVQLVTKGDTSTVSSCEMI